MHLQIVILSEAKNPSDSMGFFVWRLRMTSAKMTKKPNSKKAAKHETKGDELLAKEKPAKALKEYRKAADYNPGFPGIYDKLIKAHDQITGEWKEKDFAESVSWAMKKQEQENPSIKQVHARLSPEWIEATELAMKLFAATDEGVEKEIIEKLVAMGEIATRALIGMIIEFKKKVVVPE